MKANTEQEKSIGKLSLVKSITNRKDASEKMNIHTPRTMKACEELGIDITYLENK